MRVDNRAPSVDGNGRIARTRSSRTVGVFECRNWQMLATEDWTLVRELMLAGLCTAGDSKGEPMDRIREKGRAVV